MMFQIVVKFSSARDPIRMPHALGKLMEFARWIEDQDEYPNVKRLAPITWGCEQPVGFGLYEAGSEEELRSFLKGMRRTESIEIIPCKYLHEVIELGRERLQAMAAGQESPASPAFAEVGGRP
jgi:hypothetical protein